MKLKFLGTAAAEGVPAVFCNCDTCRTARKLGGKNIRTRSQILIDEDTLFDLPMDTYMHSLLHGIDLAKVKTVLVSHSHMDHFYPQELCMRGTPFAYGVSNDITVLCNDTVAKAFYVDTAREMRACVNEKIVIKTLSPFETVAYDDIKIISIPAKHTVGEDCFIYYVERGERGVLLLNDTGILDKEIYNKLKTLDVKANAVAFDCTYGAKRHGEGRHMGLFDGLDQVELMSEANIIAPDVKLIATHFSHNTGMQYDELSQIANEYGVIVAYDGMTVDV